VKEDEEEETRVCESVSNWMKAKYCKLVLKSRTTIHCSVVFEFIHRERSSYCKHCIEKILYDRLASFAGGIADGSLENLD